MRGLSNWLKVTWLEVTEGPVEISLPDLRAPSNSAFDLQGCLPFCCLLKCVPLSQSCLTLCDPMNYQAPLSIEFFKQECWSRLPVPSPGDLPNLGIKPRYPALQADSLLSEPVGKSKLGMADCLYSDRYLREKEFLFGLTAS